MKKFWSSRFDGVVLFAGFGLLLGVVGCGQSSSNDPAMIGSPQAPTPVIWNGTDMSSSCLQSGGYLYGKTCQIQIAGFGVLTPNYPNTPVLGLNIAVPAGAVISFSASGYGGGWSASSSSGVSLLGGLFQIGWSSWNCSTMQVDLNGTHNGNPLMNLGLPAGLVASDGTEVFFVGSYLNSRVVNHTGTLRFGFNIPLGTNASYANNYVCGNYAGSLVIQYP